MWDWLVPWWNWGAELTRLFDWEAISAVATAVAVIVALDQATRSQRAAQRRSVALLTSLIGFFEPIYEMLAHDDQGYLDPSSLAQLLQSDMIRRAQQGLVKFDHFAIGETGIGLSSEYLADVLSWVENGADASLRNISEQGPPTFSGISDLDEIYRNLVMTRARLRMGPLRLAIAHRLTPHRYDFGARPMSPNHLHLH